MGLTALPKATHLGSYSYRARRAASEKLLSGVTGRMRELGLATGAEGFNLDFLLSAAGIGHERRSLVPLMVVMFVALLAGFLAFLNAREPSRPGGWT